MENIVTEGPPKACNQNTLNLAQDPEIVILLGEVVDLIEEIMNETEMEMVRGDSRGQMRRESSEVNPDEKYDKPDTLAHNYAAFQDETEIQAEQQQIHESVVTMSVEERETFFAQESMSEISAELVVHSIETQIKSARMSKVRQSNTGYQSINQPLEESSIGFQKSEQAAVEIKPMLHQPENEAVGEPIDRMPMEESTKMVQPEERCQPTSQESQRVQVSQNDQVTESTVPASPHPDHSLRKSVVETMQVEEPELVVQAKEHLRSPEINESVITEHSENFTEVGEQLAPDECDNAQELTAKKEEFRVAPEGNSTAMADEEYETTEQPVQGSQPSILTAQASDETAAPKTIIAGQSDELFIDGNFGFQSMDQSLQEPSQSLQEVLKELVNDEVQQEEGFPVNQTCQDETSVILDSQPVVDPAKKSVAVVIEVQEANTIGLASDDFQPIHEVLMQNKSDECLELNLENQASTVIDDEATKEINAISYQNGEPGFFEIRAEDSTAVVQDSESEMDETTEELPTQESKSLQDEECLMGNASEIIVQFQELVLQTVQSLKEIDKTGQATETENDEKQGHGNGGDQAAAVPSHDDEYRDDLPNRENIPLSEDVSNIHCVPDECHHVAVNTEKIPDGQDLTDDGEKIPVEETCEEDGSQSGNANKSCLTNSSRMTDSQTDHQSTDREGDVTSENYTDITDHTLIPDESKTLYEHEEFHDDAKYVTFASPLTEYHEYSPSSLDFASQSTLDISQLLNPDNEEEYDLNEELQLIFQGKMDYEGSQTRKVSCDVISPDCCNEGKGEFESTDNSSLQQYDMVAQSPDSNTNSLNDLDYSNPTVVNEIETAHFVGLGNVMEPLKITDAFDVSDSVSQYLQIHNDDSLYASDSLCDQKKRIADFELPANGVITKRSKSSEDSFQDNKYVTEEEECQTSQEVPNEVTVPDLNECEDQAVPSLDDETDLSSRRCNYHASWSGHGNFGSGTKSWWYNESNMDHLSNNNLSSDDVNKVTTMLPLHTCSKPVRIGLSRRQRVPRLHPYLRPTAP